MPRSSVDENMLHVDWNEEAARIRAMENRTGSVGDCTKLASYRSNKPGFFRRRSTRRRISNAQRLADLGDFINTSLSKVKRTKKRQMKVSQDPKKCPVIKRDWLL
ncbi:hypothetical protein L5515_016770 [Caenorhabditis briggsae]|uniref:Uncharacterized protein n=1 Tax=Caenorhabditis briggsae TaxID=6238 RepID=A0AAE9JRS1_CAEBR|nr:hypothetical protein L5515_016770 [Caenorhabditis briggsae]